jgi:hypothetical protein
LFLNNHQSGKTRKIKNQEKGEEDPMECPQEKTLVRIEPIAKIVDYYIPKLQRLLNDDYVQRLCDDQIEEISKHGMPSALQSITCARFNSQMYTLDGQHRIRMFKMLMEKGYDLSRTCIPVIVYNVDTLSEFASYYERINKHHPINPLQLNTSDWINGKPFFDWFQKTFLKYMSSAKRCRCPHFNMEDMMNHFNTFDIMSKIRHIDEFIDCVTKLNAYIVAHRAVIQNSQIRNDLSSSFEKCLSKNSTNPCMLGVWRNYEWIDLCLYVIEHSINFSEINMGTFCKLRPKISQDLKITVWNKRNKAKAENEESGGEIYIGQCYCCDDELKFSNMECGHIIPHVKGGGIDIENLEPICKSCNTQMGIMNLHDFKKGLQKAS